MTAGDNEEEQIRQAALRNAQSILAARQRAEDSLATTQQALRESEGRLRAIFNHAAVGIAEASLDGRFTTLNRKFSEILGYGPEDLIGHTFGEITHPDDRERTADEIARLLDGGVSDYVMEKRYLRRDGATIWSLTAVTLLRDAAGAPMRFIGVIEDITSRKVAEESLREAARERLALLDSERAARSEAERLSDLKDDFLATLSHELRTPLSAILGWTRVLRGAGPSAADFARGLETIERNARLQSQLIEDLLDTSRVTSGKLRLDVQALLPVTSIEAAIDTIRPAADAKGLRIETLLDPAAGPISGDPARLQQVVWNLLSNAIKFTPRGGKIQIVLQRIDSHIEISVSDTGIGIRPDFIPHVFERFRQSDSSMTRQYGGLGLGLAIVKSLVELHGGSVAVESPGEGQGTTITVNLPVAAVRRAGGDRQHPTAVKDIDPHKPTELVGLKVIVIDDQKDARDLVKRVLEDCGVKVVTAANADAALLTIEFYRPDVIISDIGMPEVDGLELLRRIRALGPERGGKAPAIALTAFARSEDRTRALRAGFAVHVAKPVDPSELVATVASVAGRVKDDDV